MSEPKLISPMLDNYIIGDPISNRNGVRCCPAMENETDGKYIVKIVSVPAAQTQAEALLLSGAYSDKESVLSYYESLAASVSEEAETLQKLSQMEGFLPFKAWQSAPMDENEIGFDVYLISAYQKTLAKHFRSQSMTYLSALNLGLDLCAALAVCRRAGYLYVNLKPDNVYITNDNGFRIGDLGFMKLDSLNYASLPDRYRSQYTAPEIADAFSAINTTIDLYALGLILYQAYNDGNLPFVDCNAPHDIFPAPAYADYEMSEIILKACAPDPEMRWQNPIEMGQALVAYMQRNGANDTPIAPVVKTEKSGCADEEIPHMNDETEETGLFEQTADISEDDSSVAEEDVSEESQQESNISEEKVENAEDIFNYTEDDEGNFSFLEIDPDEDGELESEAEKIDYGEVSEEVSDMLEQADNLIAHPMPDPVVQPEAIDVPIPSPIIDDEENPENSDTEENEIAQSEEQAEDSQEESTDINTKKHWLRNAIIATIIVAVTAIGVFLYQKVYLQPIDSILLQDGENGELTVIVTSKIDESRLSVLCSDTYGNQHSSPIVDGKAKFTDLAPNSAYTVKVVVSGFHRLTGDTSAAYTTPSQTNIVQFLAVTGSEDGSVILSFAIDGPDSKQWRIAYLDDKKNEQETIFSGHMVTLKGLTVGNEYTFTLTPIKQLLLAGKNEVTHTASKIIKAEKVQITGCIDNVLTAVWTTPENVPVKSWTVRCYNNSDYDTTIVVKDTKASFEITDTSKEYTIEVAAEGMSVTQRAFAAANSATITDFTAKTTKESKISLSWKTVGDISSEGWLLIYTIDDGSPKELTCKGKNTLAVSPAIPGSTYSFTLQTADGKEILGGHLDYKVGAAKEFEGYSVSADVMRFMMCKRPSSSNWNRYYLSDSDYRTEFTVGEKVSYLVRMLKEYSTSEDKIVTLFVIRNSKGAVVSAETTSATWTNMWYRNYCELDIPSIPETIGKYTISVYFNGMLANENTFTVVAK